MVVHCVPRAHCVSVLHIQREGETKLLQDKVGYES